MAALETAVRDKPSDMTDPPDWADSFDPFEPADPFVLFWLELARSRKEQEVSIAVNKMTGR